ncbi:MAG TPA: hypothetical protein VGR66_02275 [Candidatus Eisenbacteria bacterium]|jgi:hypothetical protein|nr:hypothetical protein [Candidatus Eisenbacteria bacterium]
MATKITVNGVEYESVAAMPADVRKVYEETMARLAGLGDAKPTIVEGQFGPVHLKSVVRKKIVVNGGTYEDEESMPADVRQAYETATRPTAPGSNVQKNEIKFTFQVTGPNVTFRKTQGGSSPDSNPMSAPTMQSAGMPAPIEPASVSPKLLLAVGLLAGAAIALALWLLGGTH